MAIRHKVRFNTVVLPGDCLLGCVCCKGGLPSLPRSFLDSLACLLAMSLSCISKECQLAQTHCAGLVMGLCFVAHVFVDVLSDSSKRDACQASCLLLVHAWYSFEHDVFPIDCVLITCHMCEFVKPATTKASVVVQVCAQVSNSALLFACT